MEMSAGARTGLLISRCPARHIAIAKGTLSRIWARYSPAMLDHGMSSDEREETNREGEIMTHDIVKVLELPLREII